MVSYVKIQEKKNPVSRFGFWRSKEKLCCLFGEGKKKFSKGKIAAKSTHSVF